VSQLVRFRLRTRARQLDVSGHDQDVFFNSGDIRLAIRHHQSEFDIAERYPRCGQELLFEDESQPSKESPFIEAEVERAAPPEVLGLLKQAPPPRPPHTQTRDVDTIQWLLQPPRLAVTFCEGVAIELQQAASRLIQLLRWFFNRPWTAQLPHASDAEWSIDGSPWRALPAYP
jgi:hypothetical protein